ncbi:TPA: hypothetical protein IAA82_03750 [Candidatus Galligastranaerophilus gallistercoris]|nr:hypothetical protein [Candidatus Galligastranaerophilus gallistercoris]
MKSVLNFLFGFFKSENSEYIGLTSFKTTGAEKPAVKKEAKKEPEKTALTGLLKRVG